mgnify:CR=1 FL=1
MNYCFSIAEEEFDRLTKNSKMEEGRTPRSGKFVSEAALGSRIIFPIVTSVAGKFYLDAFSLFPLFPLCSVTLTLPLPRERERELERYEWPLNRREPDDGVWGRCKIRYSTVSCSGYISRALSKWRAQWDYSVHSPLFHDIPAPRRW